ncbi:MAG: hypothetical protein E4H02_06360 [Lentisphaerales bacterium]|jgi:hypothetical protein|nr:MAG: hypothetical protein E4H02_06360 [Lentisphaerales bacterium]
MLTQKRIEELFIALNDELSSRNVVGEAEICGGAVMCIVFHARAATKDVDGVFAPASEMREGIAAVARKLDVPENWLNDAAKGFFAVDPPKQDVASYSHLRIWAATAEYMLAMKCISARYDSCDKDNVIFLVNHLGLKSADKVFDIVVKYYPDESIPAHVNFNFSFAIFAASRDDSLLSFEPILLPLHDAQFRLPSEGPARAGRRQLTCEDRRGRP